MKKFILFVALAAVSFTSYSQALGYEDLGILFSQNDGNGSARFVAMGGAFGALGGDVTALAVNPAGVSVFKGSHASIAFQSRSTDYMTNYYGNTVTTQDEYFRLSSAGAVFSFEETNSNDWSRVSFGVNYRILVDFDNTFLASGNSGFATFDTFPLDADPDNPIIYGIAENQNFINSYTGDVSELNLAFGGVFQDNLHVGFGINFQDLNFAQRATLREANNDGNGNTLDARFYQENFTTGTGFNFSAGFIYKVNKSFRIGASYQSPTWFTELIEDSNIVNNDGFFGDTEIIVSNDNIIYDNTAGGFLPTQSLLYRLRTPSQITLSSAIIFGKTGLLSFDFISRNFQGLNLSGDDFTNENLFFDDSLRRTNSFNVGTEWRFNRLSLRGGYRYQQSPDANAIDSDNLQSYSAGLGYNFGTVKINLAYSNNNRTGLYNFYPQFPQVDAAEIDIDNTMVTLGIAVSL
jgi:long-subunit fatty acid transport protein